MRFGVGSRSAWFRCRLVRLVKLGAWLEQGALAVALVSGHVVWGSGVVESDVHPAVGDRGRRLASGAIRMPRTMSLTRGSNNDAIAEVVGAIHQEHVGESHVVVNDARDVHGGRPRQRVV